MKIQKYIETFTYVLPALLLFFSQFNLAYHFLSDYAYVGGYYVNYYDFVIHLVDLLLFFGFLWFLIKNKLWKNKNWVLISVFSSLLLIIHNIVFMDAIVLYWSLRIWVYFMFALSAYTWMSYLNRKEKDKVSRYILYFMSTAVIFQSIIILMQFFTNRTVGLHFLGESYVQSGISGTSSIVLPTGVYLRGYGTFPHPNVAGGFLSVGIVILICHILFSKKNDRIWFLIPVVVGFVGLFFTWSRGAWVFCAISLIAILYLFLRRRRTILVRRGIGVLMVLLGIFLVWFAVSNDSVAMNLRDRIINQSGNLDESVSQRRLLNIKAMEMYENNILTGVGLGKFIQRLSVSPVVSSSGIKIMQPAHNIFLLAAAEFGFMALWIFTFVLFHLLKGIRWNCFLVFPLFFLLIIGNIDHYPITIPQGIFILIVLSWFTVLGDSVGSVN